MENHGEKSGIIFDYLMEKSKHIRENSLANINSSILSSLVKEYSELLNDIFGKNIFSLKESELSFNKSTIGYKMKYIFKNVFIEELWNDIFVKIFDFHKEKNEIDEISMMMGFFYEYNVCVHFIDQLLGSKINQIISQLSINYNQISVSEQDFLYQNYQKAIKLNILDKLEEVLPKKRFEDWEVSIEQSSILIYEENRSDIMFDIIINYPDTLGFIYDSQNFFQTSHSKNYLITRIILNINKRLLNASVSTDDILAFYVSSFYILLSIDPSGLVQNTILKSIQNYLNTREDTVKHIIVHLDNSFSDVTNLQKLIKNPSNATTLSKNGNLTIVVDDDEIEPIKTNISAECIQQSLVALISIFGNVEKFVLEFSIRLAKHLINNYGSNDFSNEIRQIELLKRTFGEKLLLSCDLMMKDVGDSLRLMKVFKNTQLFHSLVNNIDINLFTKQSVQMDFLILSQTVWPNISTEKFTIPSQLKRMFDNYCHFYEQTKGERTLNWHFCLGMVELEIKIGPNSTKTVVCNPIYACILLQFADGEKLTIIELANRLDVSVNKMVNWLSYWTNQTSILVEDGNGYYHLSNDHNRLLTNLPENRIEFNQEGEENSKKINNDINLNENVSKIVWTFVSAMLKNLGPMTVTKIHSTLTSFTNDPSIKAIDQKHLNQFLLTKVQSGQLKHSLNDLTFFF